MSMTTKKKGLGSKGLGIEALINNKMEDFKEVSLRQQTGEAVRSEERRVGKECRL